MRRITTLVLWFVSGCSGSTNVAVSPEDLSGGLAGANDGAAPIDLTLPVDAAVPTPVDATSPPLPGSDGGSNALVAARPYLSKVPAGSTHTSPAAPLLILLHGYTASGVLQDSYFGLSQIVDSKGFLYAYPDGTQDQMGNRFWNATDACCDLYGTGVDDVAYINAVIDDMSVRYNVDPKRIFLAGHSNGAFMSHRLACDSASRIAAIVALAGDNWNDPMRCMPSRPVAVLQVHGDADATIAYHGGLILGHAFPSAHSSVGTWVTRDGCGATSQMGAPLDLDRVLPGAETTVEKWTGCKPGGAAELWTIHGGSHIPSLQPTWADTIYTWLSQHPKP